MSVKGKRQERQTIYMIYIWQGLLAQLQDKACAIDDAPASIVGGLALAEQTGGHRADSFLRWVRGHILAERDPAAPKPSTEKPYPSRRPKARALTSSRPRTGWRRS